MVRINGRSSFDRRSVLTIPLGDGDDGKPDTVTAQVRAFPLNVTDYLLQRLPEPLPPKRPLRGQDGRPVRDQGRPVYHEDDRDPAYRAARNHHGHLMTVALFLEVLDDPSWTFDTARPAAGTPDSDPSWGAYYEGVYKELVASGLPAAAIAHVGRTIKRLAGLTERDVAEEAERFLPETAGTAIDGTSDG